MKHLLLCSVLSMGILPMYSPVDNLEISKIIIPHLLHAESKAKGLSISLQEPGNEKMMATVFRAQDFCRLEMKDFEWEVEFNIVSATVYFSGSNFKNVEKGAITSKSLKPLKKYIDRCVPGSMVVFDNVQVMGPDKMVRTIPGVSYILH